MNTLGQLCLFAALVGAGYAAFACVAGIGPVRRGIGRSGLIAAVISVLALTMVIVVLARALVIGDSNLAYVAEYSTGQLVWYYSLSALWAGQAGSLLVWAWFLSLLALAYRLLPRRNPSPLREPAFGVLSGCLFFLVATMVFGADPMKPCVAAAGGQGLTPLLQHPAMLIHPPIVFLGYAAWTIPFALAVTALATGRLDSGWAREARPWALLAWVALGGGILIGAQWAYEEFGWGGYWSWDPVENGSLIPWLTGTALIHCMFAWRCRGILKKTALSLAIATFAGCNFASFLTRSGIFGGLHNFSQSPIGWLFLALMVGLTVTGGALIGVRRRRLAPGNPIGGLWTRESLVLMSTIALMLLATLMTIGTLAVPLSQFVAGRPILVGKDFYNNVLIATGLPLLGATALVPLLNWQVSPSRRQWRVFATASIAGGLAVLTALALGILQPTCLIVAFISVVAMTSLAGVLTLDNFRGSPQRRWIGLFVALWTGRRRYVAYVIHLGLVCLGIGITAYSFGSRECRMVMNEGQKREWSGLSIHLVRLVQHESPDSLLVEAELDISGGRRATVTLRPTQHYRRLRDTWTSEAAIHATWSGDLYTVFHGDENGSASLTVIENPLIGWIRLGGWVMAAGAMAALWPTRRRALQIPEVPAPKLAARPHGNERLGPRRPARHGNHSCRGAGK